MSAERCTTHHHSCDCREEKIKIVAEALIESHENYKSSNQGVTYNVCYCAACQAAKELITDGG